MDVGDCDEFDTRVDAKLAWTTDGGVSGGAISLQYQQTAI